MNYLSTAGHQIIGYLKKYPKTTTIRAAAMVLLAGYFLVFPAAKPIALVIAASIFFSYLLTWICRFLGIEFRTTNRYTSLFAMCLGPYAIFEIIWNLLSSSSEVDEI